MKKYITITHNQKNYELKIDGWFNHIDTSYQNAQSEIITDEIIIIDGIKVREFKAKAWSKYEILSDKNGLSYKQYLDQEISQIYGVNWEQCIEYLKNQINSSFIRLLTRDLSQKMTTQQQHELLKIASNGHVAAMFFIGTALADGNDENALMWLSMAHNAGHIGACYEMSIFLRKQGNTLNYIRCLILAADKGMDIAYISIFHFEHIKKIVNVNKPDEFHAMLDELITARPDSGARFFKGLLLVAEGNMVKGKKLLNSLLKRPKNKRPESEVDSTYQNQIDYAQKVIGKILDDVKKGIDPISAVFNVYKDSNPKPASQDDYVEFVKVGHKLLYQYK